MSNDQNKKVGVKKLLFTLLILYFSSLSIRIYDIRNDEYQPDEYHWIERSSKIVSLFNRGDYSTLTSHLDHPGIPPAILMAMGEAGAKAYNSSHGLVNGDSGFVDGLTGARMMIAIISSLIAPLIFYFVMQFWSRQTALLTSVLFAFDPIHIGLSREAHLDSILSLFVVIAAFLFVAAERNQKLFTKLLAGMFWGLAMATKVSAIGFLAALICYRLLTVVIWVVSKKRINLSLRNKPVLITWSDLGAILVGHLTLAILYTRLWTKQFEFSVLKQVSSDFADRSYQFASWLRYGETIGAKMVIVLAVMGFIAGICLAFRAKQRTNSKFIFPGAIILLIVSGLIVTHCLVPSLIDNFIRLYLRMLWLKDVPHLAYGHAKPAIPYGYLFIILNRLTPVMLVGVVIFVTLLTKENWRKLLLPDFEKTKMLLILLVVAFVWIGVLELSSKKTIRYIIPVVPFFYLIAAMGWHTASTLISNYCHRRIALSRLKNNNLVTYACCGLVVFQLGIAVSIAPDFMMYYSPFLGGFKGAVKRNLPMPILGQAKIIRFLDSQPRGDFVERKVRVIGDHEMLQQTTARLARPDVMPIRFTPQHGYIEGYYLVVYWSFYNDIDPGYMKKIMPTPFTEGMRIFDYYHQGVNIASIFSFPMASLEKPIYFNFEDMMQATGKREFYQEAELGRSDQGVKAVTAVPGRDEKGYVALNYEIVVRGGDFKLGTLIGIPADIKLDPALTPERYVVRLEITKDCKKIVTLGELSQRSLKWIEFSCRAEQSRDYNFRAYWFGNVPVVLKKIRLSR